MTRRRTETVDSAPEPETAAPWIIRDTTGNIAATGNGDGEKALENLIASEIIPIFDNTLPNEKVRREKINTKIREKYKIYY